MNERRADVLLVGGGVAAVRCARALRRAGFDGSVLLVGKEDRLPYNRPPLSKEFLRNDVPADLLAAEPASWYAARGIEVVTGSRVDELDLDGLVAGGSDRTRFRFERVVIATGARLRPLSVPGGDEVLMLRTAEDALRLRRAALTAGAGASVVVVGGGFIGLEVASGLAALGLRPTVVELADVLWGGTLGTELAAWAAARLEAAGVALRLGASVEAVEDGGVVVRGERLPAAFTVAGIGVEPRVELAVGAGLAVDDGIVVDAGGRTGHAGAWAAGDVARVDGTRRVEHWHAARESGDRVGRSLLGMELDPAQPAWVFSEIGGVSLDVIGMPPGWGEERWLDEAHTVLAYLDGEQVVGLASIGGVVAAADARRWIGAGAGVAEVAASLA